MSGALFAARRGDMAATGGVVAPPTFDPATVAGMLSWFKADSLSLSDGDPVASWTDSSGNSRPATQATPGARPTYRTAVQNGRPVVRFDGADDYLRTAAFDLGQTFTALVVGRFTGSVNANNDSVFDSASGSNVQLYRTAAASSTTVGVYAASAVQTTTTPLAWHLYTCVVNGASSLLDIDGLSTTTGELLTAGSSGLTLGASKDTNQNVAFDMGEAIFYGAALSSGDRAYLRQGFGAKWGVTVA